MAAALPAPRCCCPRYQRQPGSQLMSLLLLLLLPLSHHPVPLFAHCVIVLLRMHT